MIVFMMMKFNDFNFFVMIVSNNFSFDYVVINERNVDFDFFIVCDYQYFSELNSFVSCDVQFFQVNGLIFVYLVLFIIILENCVYIKFCFCVYFFNDLECVINIYNRV